MVIKFLKKSRKDLMYNITYFFHPDAEDRWRNTKMFNKSFSVWYSLLSTKK